MATIKFLGNEGSPDQVEWNGVVFPVGEAVEMDMAIQSHRHMMEKAAGNQFFETDSDDIEVVSEDAPIGDGIEHAPAAEPEPVEETAPINEPAGDYVPVDDIQAMDELALRATLKALGINPGGRSSVETLREKLEKAYGTHV